jgi:hypothetical protein
MSKLLSVSDANTLIDAGKRLHVAGDEAVLVKLHKGNWIGGTIPYFLTHEGGMVDRQHVFVSELPPEVIDVKVGLVAVDELERIPGDAPVNGFAIAIIPGMSEVHTQYALKADRLPRIFETPIIGWVSGVHLDELGSTKPKVFNGQTGERSEDRVAVLYAQLAEHAFATIGIVNVFEQGKGDTFVFDKAGFAADSCLINGERASFYDYMVRQHLDVKLPLVANRSGEMINVSFQAVDDEGHSVKFYAPVLENIEYRHAAPIKDYRENFVACTQYINTSPAFSCNCILNYIYGELEGKQYIPIDGPATFGEIAYVILNQTMVYLNVNTMKGR